MFLIFVFQEGVNDFSTMSSSKSKIDLLVLGPVAYINHSCSPNTVWTLKGESTWCAQTLRPIVTGEEITTDYGKHFLVLIIHTVNVNAAKKKYGEDLLPCTFTQDIISFYY